MNIPDNIPDNVGAGSVFAFAHEGFEVKIRVVDDEDADTSWLGEFSDSPQEGAIDHHATDTWLARGWRGPRYFNPVNPECGQEDYERLVAMYQGHWSMVGLTVTVYREGVELGAASLWGIESDSGHDYFCETIAEELVPEAIGQAKKTIERLCACE